MAGYKVFVVLQREDIFIGSETKAISVLDWQLVAIGDIARAQGFAGLIEKPVICPLHESLGAGCLWWKSWMEPKGVLQIYYLIIYYLLRKNS